MNKFNYIGACALLLSTGLVGCNDLDTQPMSKYVTSLQKTEAIEAQPSLANAGVVGIPSSYTPYGAVYNAHFDFGWPAVMMFMDAMGQDMVTINVGYNHFATGANYSLGTNNNYVNNMAWYHAYKIIKAANDVVGSIDPETTNPSLQMAGAQGYANRAYMYFMLAQLFQYTYVGHTDLPCVPIITDLNANEAAAGIPRSSVEEVYGQIMSDLNKAIQFLTDCKLSPSTIADVGVKRFVSLGAAYGLRARVNLVMNKWAEAAADAQMAIQTSGATPYSIAEASRPAFISSDEHNWMWAVYVQINDRVVTTQLCNWPSFMGSFNDDGYWVDAQKKISKTLWNQIPDTDCRKGWWIDENFDSPNINDAEYEFLRSWDAEAYTNVKFGPYQNQLATTTNANDIPLMRVEEMYLIMAEATAMAGNPAGGKQILEDFVKTYRNPSYVCPASTAQEIQEEVWMQRRVELWGEGISYTDLLRLNKGFDRRGGGWQPVWVYNVPAPLKPLLVPNGEMEANSAIVSN
ncbi:MAG: RagB/SusD family nutrient uptake outer membrane protein, partial [Muribaculaceae bacterium]|nr:RagB/SusD family nutrient uptake outer membrane protein [Muribaculaceae bacterium]